MNARTTKRVTVGGIGATLAAAVLTGALLLPNGAGADPIEGDGALKAVPTPNATTAPPLSADADRTAHDAWVEQSIAALDEGKKNEDGLDVRTGQVNVVLSTGNEFQTGRAHIDFTDHGLTDFDPEAEEVTVVITPVRNLDQNDNAPVVVQVSENSPTGFNVRALNKHLEGIDGQEVRFTFVAYAS